MLFGRVQAVAEPVDERDDVVRVVVVLETSSGIRTVRDEVVLALRVILGPDDLIWIADQYAQETIGTELAEEGWEVIGAGDPPESRPDLVPGSALYVVRRIPQWS